MKTGLKYNSSIFFITWSPDSVGTICPERSESHCLCQLCQIWQQIQMLGKRTWVCPSTGDKFFKGAKWLTPDRTGICNFLVALAVLRCTQGQSESNSIFLLWFASCHKLKVAYKLFCCCCWGNERGDCAFRGVLQEVNFFWWHWNMLF